MLQRHLPAGQPGCRGPSTLPAAASIEGLDGPLSATDLQGPTTEYSAASADSMWFPVPGGVQRLDPSTGEIVSTISAGDATRISRTRMAWQPRETGSGLLSSVPDLWSASIRSQQIAQTIDLDVAPYALALDRRGPLGVLVP